jgi:hypothetical protein
MNYHALKEKVGTDGWEVDGYRFVFNEEDKSIEVRLSDNSKGATLAFMLPGNTELYVSGDNILTLYKHVVELSRITEVTLPGFEFKERIVQKSDEAKEKYLSGKVEAYEKILIGRDISASK